MRVHLGADHAGYDVKEHLAERLRAAGHDVVDHGPVAFDALDDYPPFCLSVGAGVVADPGSLGIVLGGSGNGEQIAANKITGVRAALAWSVATATLAREHNDANVIGIGARQHDLTDIEAIVDAFLSTPFSGDDRHSRRIAMLTDYEATGVLPPVPGR
jgi:ribose 5-phosphate isomerase B